MQSLENSTSSSREIIYEVRYKRISIRSIIYTLGCIRACYLYTQSPITAIGAGILGSAIFTKGAVGHACLLTPSEEIASHSSLNFVEKKKSKVFGDVANNCSKNPRIQVRIKATA